MSDKENDPLEDEAAALAERLANLLAGRAKIQDLLYRFESFLGTCDQAQKHFEIKARLGKIESIWDELDQVQSCIEQIDASEEQKQVRVEFENLYFKVVGQAGELLNKNVQPNVQVVDMVSSTQRTNIPHTSHDVATNLPAINLPIFTGSYEGWVQFYEIFKSIIDQNSRLSNIQKLYYLQSCLKGDASQVIQSLEMSSSNYEVAINLLKERYENKKILIHNHVKSLFEILPVAKESHFSLRKLLDIFTKNIRALKSLGEPVDSWDTLLIHIITTKLDFFTRKEWENHTAKKSPKLDDLLDFLKQKCQTLETLDNKIFDKNANKNPRDNPKQFNQKIGERMVSHVSTGGNYACCTFCKQKTHYTHRCQRLLNLPLKERSEKLKTLGICINCLKMGHKSEACSSSTCRVCRQKHNTILCDISQKSPSCEYKPNKQNLSESGEVTEASQVVQNKVAEGSNNTQVTLASHVVNESKQVLLATAIVYIYDATNKPIRCRALLDSASQSNFCTEELSNRLGLEGKKINTPVSGLNQSCSYITQKITSKVQSIDKSYTTNLQFLVIDRITTNLPQYSFESELLNIPANIILADYKFNISQKIDVLLGTDIFFELLCKEKIELGPNKPIIQNTKLGWILAGPLQINYSQNPKTNSFCFLSTTTINDTLEKFWKVETVELQENKLSNEELECEADFSKNVQCDETGKYIVKYPVKDNVCELGESLQTAHNRFLNAERRLGKNADLKTYYTEFLKEYLEMGHMTKVEAPSGDSAEIYCYLPHHSVVKESSATTKVRVVFDASCKTSSGLSLNDVLKVGPKVQNDFFDIVIRMRTYPIVITADVEKMFRSIWIHESQRNLQRIIWRENHEDEMSHFVLNTVTYGTSSSAYLATRVLNEIGVRCKDTYPEISEIILNDFYMDDLITGAQNLSEAISIKQNIDKILSESGFNLRKYLSSDNDIFEKSELNSDNKNRFHIKSDTETKTLGISWDPDTDTFNYTYQCKFNATITKRTILSGIAQLFDPMGIVGPVIVTAKLLMQQLWREQLDWDQPVSSLIENQWRTFVNNLKHLNEIKIPRFVETNQNDKIDIHGFCDASETMYGACIYLRSCDSEGKITCNLLCSKSRIAPISFVSLPRLELCGALLLAQLMFKVLNALRIKINKINYWTDSEIVLAWIKEQPCKWKVFVANRVAEIQRLSENGTWRHIESKLNPADIISRGAQAQELLGMSLWWHGPNFLTRPKSYWPETNSVNVPDVPEVRKIKVTLSHVSNTREMFLFDRWSIYAKLERICAYINRFIFNCRTRATKLDKLSGALSVNERDSSLKMLCRLAQEEVFSKEIKLLHSDKRVYKESKLINLNPFLDNDGLIRVGGRLKNSYLSYDENYQIILPPKHKLTELLINHYHLKYMHAGPQFVLSQIRTKFWPLNGRNEIRKVIHKCLTCIRVKPTSVHQLMGELPEARVRPSRPFTCCGLDYAGPFYLKDGKTRSRILIKAYVCVFICMATRAVHAELVTDLSSEAFMNAFKRFVARRGLTKHIYSDNATTFIGANTEIQKLCQIVSKVSEQTPYQEYFSQNKITWHNIPPRSPHHGGIWEAAVRSFKYHLKRVIGDSKLNFEQFYTILVQVESILNSRPILPLSEDPADLQALTPGHFLIGESLVAVPQDNVAATPSNRLKIFKHLQQIVQQFWVIWSKDYLHTLQQRGKWRTCAENIKINDLVLLKEEHLPPMQWLLGRIEAVHPGQDNIVRVVSVRTKKGVFKRAITQISPLPKE